LIPWTQSNCSATAALDLQLIAIALPFAVGLNSVFVAKLSDLCKKNK
jgi:hypothetical protein